MREGRGGYENFRSSEERAEMERKERWARLWENFEIASNPDARLEALEQIAAQAALEAKDGFAAEIALKFAQKVSIKRTVADIDRHRDDDTYQPLKALGIFVVHHRTMEHAITDPVSGVDLRQGDQVLDLHLPPVRPEQRKKLRSLAEDSFEKIAEYIVRHKLEPKYITGITYAALAKLAPKFGFDVRTIPLPEELSEPVRRVYEQTERGEKGEPIGDIALVYQTLDKFLSRWKPENKENENDLDFTNLQTIEEVAVTGDERALEKLKDFLRKEGFSEKRIDASIAAARLRDQVVRNGEDELLERKKSGILPTEDELSMGTFIEGIESPARDSVRVVRAKGYDTYQSGFDWFDKQSLCVKQSQFADLDPKVRTELEIIGVEVKDGRISFATDADISVEGLKRKWDAIAALLPDLGRPAPPAQTKAAKTFRNKYGKTQ